MLKRLFALTLAAAALALTPAHAQAPAAAPAGATGICKDGTYTTQTTKSGACGGHKGIQTWYAAAPAANAAVAKPMPAPAAAPAKPEPAPKPAPPPPAISAAPSAPALSAAKPSRPGPAAVAAAKTAAPGGGPGMVWFNADSKVYHCPGSPYYGKTKSGAYMSEADAKAKGGKPSRNQPCPAS